MKFKLPLYLLVFVLCCSAAVSIQGQQKNCLPSPVGPASPDPNIFNEEQEIFLSEAISQRIQKDYTIIEDKALIGYLNAMGEKLLQHLPLKQTRLQFSSSIWRRKRLCFTGRANLRLAQARRVGPKRRRARQRDLARVGPSC